DRRKRSRTGSCASSAACPTPGTASASMATSARVADGGESGHAVPDDWIMERSVLPEPADVAVRPGRVYCSRHPGAWTAPWLHMDGPRRRAAGSRTDPAGGEVVMRPDTGFSRVAMFIAASCIAWSASAHDAALTAAAQAAAPEARAPAAQPATVFGNVR